MRHSCRLNYKNVQRYTTIFLFGVIALTRVSTAFSAPSVNQLIEQSDKPEFLNTGIPQPWEMPLANNNQIKSRNEMVKPPHNSTSFLPLWGDEARARGYDLPEPFGININYMNIRQNIHVNSINFANLGWDNFRIPSGIFDIKTSKTREKSKTETLKLDAWILPFMDIYGIIGHTHGSSLSKVSVDSDPAKFHDDFMQQIISQVIHGMNQQGTLKDLDFKLKFKGTTYGVGTVLVTGYDNVFGMLDMNYTQTHFDILDGNIDAFTLSPRVGYRFTLPGIPYLNNSQSTLNVWVGSMYQHVQQEFKGSLNDLSMPANLQQLLIIANQNHNGRFDVKQSLDSPWNMLVGASYEVNRSFNINTEVGFSKRNSVFVSAEYRF